MRALVLAAAAVALAGAAVARAQPAPATVTAECRIGPAFHIVVSRDNAPQRVTLSVTTGYADDAPVFRLAQLEPAGAAIRDTTRCAAAPSARVKPSPFALTPPLRTSSGFLLSCTNAAAADLRFANVNVTLRHLKAGGNRMTVSADGVQFLVATAAKTLRIAYAPAFCFRRHQ